MIRLENINRQFGPRVLFNELTWMIPADARLGLVGPNGAGKTTLLRLLTGADEPDAGTVHRPRSLKIGYLPQEVETLPGGSVLAVVMDGFREVARLELEMKDVERQLASRVRAARRSPRRGAGQNDPLGVGHCDGQLPHAAGFALRRLAYARRPGASASGVAGTAAAR